MNLKQRKPVLVFSGIGTQWPGMAAELIDSEPDFNSIIRRFDAAFTVRAGWSPLRKIRDGEDISDVATGHPCVIAVECGLSQLLLGRGVHPRAVIGHSGGEIAAAFAAGVISIEDAALITWCHSRLLSKIAGSGAMMHVSLPATELDTYIADNPSITIAAENSPFATVLAGKEATLQKVMDAVTADTGVFCRILRVDIPLHTDMVEPYLDELEQALAPLSPLKSNCTVYSSMRGARAEDHDYDAKYWREHIRRPVRFGNAVAAAISDGADTFIEVAPHAVLQDAIRDCAHAAEKSITLSAVMNRDKAVMPGIEAAITLLEPNYPASDIASDRNAPDINVSRILEASPSQRQSRMKQLIGDCIENVSHGTVVPSDELEFSGMGVTSLLAVQIRNELRRCLGIDIPTTIVFNYPTIGRLADHLLGLLDTGSAPAESPETRHTGDKREPLAIVGFACRLPGGAHDIDSFWTLLENNVDAVCPVPSDRWDADGYYDPDSSVPGKSHTREGGFLTIPLDGFDADFFNIPSREARQLDPQQRLLLEVMWESFENAGIDISTVGGGNIGVFLGMSSIDYSHAHRDSYCRDTIDAYTLTGSTFSAAAGRLAYLYDFRGPCFTVDTACSSSLIALHSACRSLREGESDMTVVAGVNLMLMPDLHVAFTKLGAVSKDGRSKTFDDGADGYGRGEGCVVLLLKRLSDAERDKDTIWALVRGSATNQDGKSNGLTAPNGVSQEKVISEALLDAGLEPEDVNYVEAHGTGTALGDSIEISSLAAAYCTRRDADNPLLIGSVKANIGHLEPAAGVAAIAKTLLSFKHQLIPANIHIKTPNTRFEWDRYPIEAPVKNTAWAPNGRIRRAGVSAFGFSGTNVHAILEEYIPPKSPETADADKTDAAEPPSHFILPLSAESPESLGELKERYATLTETLTPRELANACHTAFTGRARHRYRLAVTGGDGPEITERLRFSDAPEHPAGQPRTGMLFTGQGSQYPAIGQALYNVYPAFTHAIDQCAEILSEKGIDLMHLLYGDVPAGELANTVNAQPVIASVEYAIWRQWLAWGVKPDVVAGHSIGEYPAAVAAGIMDVGQMLTLVAARAEAMGKADKNGTMAAIFTREEVVAEKLAHHGDVVIAAVNAPESLTVAGPGTAIDALLHDLEAEGIGNKTLKVSHAFHSPLMAKAAEAYGNALENVSFTTPDDTIFVSTVTGEKESDAVINKNYWIEQITRQVRFKDAAALMLEECDVLLETGGTAALSGLVKQAAGSKPPVCIPSLSPKTDAVTTMFQAAATLFNAGIKLDGEGMFAPFGCERTTLPTYPFKRESYWMPVVTEPPNTGPAGAHPVLGRRLESPALNGAIVFETLFDDNGPVFLHEHVIYGLPISPGAGHIAMLLAAVREIWGSPHCMLRDIDFLTPLVVPEGSKRHVQVIIDKANDANENNFRLAGKQEHEKEWTIHCRGVITRALPESPDSGDKLHVPISGAPPLSTDDFYTSFIDAGYEIGEGFQRITDIEPGDDMARCRVTVRRGNHSERGHVAYPGAIDSILQCCLPCFFHSYMNDLLVDNATLIPMHIDSVTLWRDFPDEVICYSQSDRNTDSLVRNDILAMDENGDPVMKLSGLLMQKTNRHTLYRALNAGAEETLYAPSWKEPASPPPSSDGELIVISLGAGTLAGAIHSQRGGVLLDTHDVNDSPEKLVTAVGNGISAIVLACDDGINETGRTYPAEITAEKAIDASMTLVNCTKLLNEKKLKATISVVVTGKDDGSGGWSDIVGASLRGTAMSLIAEDASRVGGIVSCCMDDASIATTAAMLGGRTDDTPIPFGMVRDGRYFSHTLDRMSAGTEISPVRNDGSYLITGGNGALGLQTAQWLAKKGAGCLILLSRSGVHEADLPVLEAIRSDGCQVTEYQCDVANRDDLATVFKSVAASLPPVRGVFHAAGVLDDATIPEQTSEKFGRVVMPKALGALLLHEMTLDMALDYFVLYSSAASLLCSGGQANYSAANTMLNALAAQRKANGHAALSVCWGPWLDSGMAAEDERRGGRLAAGGILGIDAKTAFPALEKSSASPQPVAGVMAMDWELYFAARPLFPGEYLSALAAKYSSSKKTAERETSVLKNLLDEYRPDRLEELEHALADIAAMTFGMNDSSRIVIQQPLMEQGFDSLMAVEVRNRLMQETGLDLDASFLFNYPTIEKIAAYFAESTLNSAAESVESTQDTGDILKDIEDLLG